MADNQPSKRRAPLTGVVSIEWVDGSDPADASEPPNFGWFGVESEPTLEPQRLLVLLREVADALEADLEDGSA